MGNSGRGYYAFGNKKPHHRFGLHRGLSLLLVLCMAVLGLPFAAFAEYDADGHGKVTDMTLKKLVLLHPMAALILLVAVLSLLALFAVLTFVIRAQNRKLNSNLGKIKRDKQILDKLCGDYTAVYYINLDTGEYEVLKVAENSNAKGLLSNQQGKSKTFDEFTRIYGQAYLPEDEREKFVQKFTCAYHRCEYGRFARSRDRRVDIVESQHDMP